MTDFPLLKTGAVTQYPSRRQFAFATRVLRFLNGSEQRFRLHGQLLRQWSIDLDLLTEDELSRLRAFFLAQQGRAQSFAFVDPWDNAEYPDCSLEADGMDIVLRGEEQGTTELVIRENLP